MSTPALLDLPGEISPRRVVAGGDEFAVLTAGSGPVVLLVPGWTGSKEDFSSVLVPIAARGYCTVAVDLRGQHETPGTSDPSAYSIPALADDLMAVLDALGTGPAHVVGHSFGGLVAQSLALQHAAALRSLTLLCSGPGALPADRHPLLRAMAAAIDSAGLESTWQAKCAYEQTQGQPQPPEPQRAFLQRRFLANHPSSLREITRHLATAPDRTAELAGSSIPILVAFGEHDDGWPVDMQIDMAARLGAPAVRISGTAHSPAVEDPKATVSVLAEFWERHGPSPARGPR